MSRKFPDDAPSSRSSWVPVLDTVASLPPSHKLADRGSRAREPPEACQYLVSHVFPDWCDLQTVVSLDEAIRSPWRALHLEGLARVMDCVLVQADRRQANRMFVCHHVAVYKEVTDLSRPAAGIEHRRTEQAEGILVPSFKPLRTPPCKASWHQIGEFQEVRD